MKLKLAYFYAAYEVGTFVYEMKKRNATSIKFEFQESVGKFNIYIDDSAFKTIDGKIGWQIIRSLYSTVTKKSKESFDKDKSFTEDKEFKSDDLNDSFSFKLLPLTKGRCLSYSYIKKKGGVYEASIKVKSDNLKDFIAENIADLNSKISNETPLFFQYSEQDVNSMMEVENAIVKGDKIKLYLVDENDEDHSVVTHINEFESKSDVKSFFSRIKEKETKKEVEEKPKEVSWEEEKKISWD